ncbi:MAG: hypothetical protein ACFFBX_04255 [Promethearchaeota archaeon]
MSSSSTWGYRTKDLVLGALAGKVTQPSDIAQSEKALLSVNEGSLYFPIFFQNTEVGGVFIGFGQAIIDAIVDTKRGALGQSHEFLWNGSLLLLSEDGDWKPPITSPVKEKDVKVFLLSSLEEAQERAQMIFDRFLNYNRNWCSDTFIQRHRGWLATILDRQRGKCSIITSDNRLVVKMGELKVIIHGNNFVKTEGRKKVVVAGRGGPLIRFG